MINKLFGLEGKVALVTGASKGLGRSMSEALAVAGADVVLTARTMSLLEETAGLVARHGRRALPIKCDVGDDGNVQEMVKVAAREMGKIDILVNNAGMQINKAFRDETYDNWDRHLKVNLYSAFSTCKAVGPLMVKQKKGKVINIVSVLGVRAFWNTIAYSTTKGALIQFTRAMALEWARFNINVNAIGPGWFKTEIVEILDKYPESKKMVLGHIPFGRLGEPAELSGVVIFLASPASDYMTGETVFVDGGYNVI
ncbi:MAG TPA: glucose 1-dehydrogenase [Syntrophales bacterium]|nr:glucose 1-dehydrogenase [Syntrophales bacterium]